MSSILKRLNIHIYSENDNNLINYLLNNLIYISIEILFFKIYLLIIIFHLIRYGKLFINLKLIKLFFIVNYLSRLLINGY